MIWYLILIVCVLILVIFVIVSYIRDASYRRKSTVETMGNGLWDEISGERERALDRRRRFRKVLIERLKRNL